MAALDPDDTNSDEHGQREILRTTNTRERRKLCVHAFVNPTSLWESTRKKVPKSCSRHRVTNTGRAVLGGDVVKDDSGSFAVLTEQGSSASQMMAAKVLDVLFQTSKMRRTSGAVSASTQVKMMDAYGIIENCWNRSAPPFGLIHLHPIGQNFGTKFKNLWLLLKGIVRTTTGRMALGATIRKSLDIQFDGRKLQDNDDIALRSIYQPEKIQLLETTLCIEITAGTNSTAHYHCRKDWSCLKTWAKSKWQEGNNLEPLPERFMKQEEREERTQLLDRIFLGCTQRERKPNKNLVDECKKMFETSPPHELLRSYLVRENRPLRSPPGPVTYKDMRRNAWKGTPE